MDDLMAACAALVCILGIVLSVMGATGEWRNRSSFVLWLGYVTVIIAIAGGFAYVQKRIWQKEDAPKTLLEHAFSVNYQTVISNVRRGGGYWWLEHRFGDELVISPVNILMFIRLTNLQSYPVMVDAYAVEITIDGNWVPLIKMNAQKGTIYMGSEDKSVAFDLAQIAFDRVLYDKRIVPNETVRGWGFFEYPQEVTGAPAAFRFRMRDFSGGESVEPLCLIEIGSTTQEGSALQSNGIFRDLSKHRRILYSATLPNVS